MIRLIDASQDSIFVTKTKQGKSCTGEKKKDEQERKYGVKGIYKISSKSFQHTVFNESVIMGLHENTKNKMVRSVYKAGESTQKSTRAMNKYDFECGC